MFLSPYPFKPFFALFLHWLWGYFLVPNSGLWSELGSTKDKGSQILFSFELFFLFFTLHIPVLLSPDLKWIL